MFITENLQLEFAIQDSRKLNEIVHVTAPDPQGAVEWLQEHYDVGTCWLVDAQAYDVWASEGDFRLTIAKP